MNEQDPWGRPGPRREPTKRPKKQEPDEDKELPGWAKPSRRTKKRDGLIRQLLAMYRKYAGSNGDGNKKPPKMRTLFTAIGGVVLLIWGSLGFYVVDEQERGVVLRFGEYIGTVEPGLRWQPYLIDKVIVINVTRVRSFSSRGIMLTQNENIVDVTVEVQYDIQDARSFALQVRDPEMSIRQATDSALRHVVGSTDLDQVITEGRAQVATDVRARVQHYITNYGTGIRVVQVNIQRADPPQEVKPAFEDAISAREDEVRFRNQAEAYAKAIVPQARGEARRILEEGQGYKEQKIARAEGDAQRFDLVYEAYREDPSITQRRLYLEAMEEILANSDKVLIDVSKGNNLLYLPLDKMLERSATSGNVAPTGGTRGAPPSRLNDAELSRIVDSVLEKIDLNTFQRNGR